MLLLTGATGLVGSALLRRLLDDGQPVRCLVRDPRRLGPLRVRVQIALGDLSDPRSFRNAMRGVQTVVHLATVTRDQPRGSIEELTAMATWRMVKAAERAGVERFLFLSALGASRHHPARLMRAKAVAEQAVREASLQSVVVAPSFVYAPGDRWLRLLERLSRLPVIPLPGSGHARCQPIWAEDVADCLMAALSRSAADGGPDVGVSRRYELAGPETLTYDDAIRTMERSIGRNRPIAHIPAALASRLLEALEDRPVDGAPVTWAEAQLLWADMLAREGTTDARSLGVQPRAMASVLGPAGTSTS
ncbi:MAG: SDR family oxidoreductase [Solirubrobacteraceae bacterium]